MSIAPANATDATAMETDPNAEMTQDPLEAAANRVLDGEGEEALTSPLKRNRKAVCTLTPNHHPIALHLGKHGYPQNPGKRGYRGPNMGESPETKNKRPMERGPGRLAR